MTSLTDGLGSGSCFTFVFCVVPCVCFCCCGFSSYALPPSQICASCVALELIGCANRSKSFIPLPLGAMNLSLVSFSGITNENRCPGDAVITNATFSFASRVLNRAPAAIPSCFAIFAITACPFPLSINVFMPLRYKASPCLNNGCSWLCRTHTPSPKVQLSAL